MLKLTDYIGLGAAEYSDELIGLRLSTRLHIGGKAGPSYIDVLLSGVSPLALTNALGLNYIKALGATEQRNLPSEYTQVEYLESSGTQWIDTGYIANGGIAIEAKAAPGGTSGAYTLWIGSIGTSDENPDNTRNTVSANGSTLSWQKGRTYNGAGFVLSNNNPVVIYMNTIGNAFEGKANGTTLNVNPSSVQQTLTGLTTTVKIGYSDYSNATRAMTIYYFKMWNNNYELIQNLIPCRRKSDNVLGMYDTVTGTFLTNAGTGTFTAGADVVPSPDNPVDIICNNGVVKVNSRTSGKNAIDTSDTEQGYLVSTVGQLPTIAQSTASTVIKNAIKVINGKKYKFSYYSNITGYRESNIVNNNGIVTAKVTFTCNVGLNEYIIEANTDGYLWVTVQLGDFATVQPAVYEIGQIYADGTQETVNIIGKNLWDPNGTDYGWLSPSGVFTEGGVSRMVEVEQGKTYTYKSYSSTNPFYNCIGLYDANKNFIAGTRRIITTGDTKTNTVTITDANVKYLACSYYTAQDQREPDWQMIVEGDGNIPYEPYFNGGTANAEMLLQIQGIKDNQELLTGNVTRNIGIKVLDGTENWSAVTNGYSAPVLDESLYNHLICTHFVNGIPTTDLTCSKLAGSANLNIHYNAITTVEQFKSWLATQYANGTPVIVVYPLATSTTETVTGQSLTASGNCTVTATGSIDNLSLEVSYKQGV